MKKLILLSLVLASCEVKKVPRSELVGRNHSGHYGIERFEFEGHDYLISGQGGICHSESCKCHEQ